jgi:hypothetical protein
MQCGLVSTSCANLKPKNYREWARNKTKHFEIRKNDENVLILFVSIIVVRKAAINSHNPFSPVCTLILVVYGSVFLVLAPSRPTFDTKKMAIFFHERTLFFFRHGRNA